MRSFSLAISGCIFPFLALALAGLPAAAQVNLGRWASVAHAGPATQVGPASAAEINASNNLGPGADLHLEFPIFNRALPNRAQLQATLVYDSLFWQAPGGSWQPQTGAGWWLRTAGAQLIESDQVDAGVCGWNDGSGDDGSGEIDYYSFVLQEPDGTSVPIGTVMVVSPPYGRRSKPYYWDCPRGNLLPKTFSVSDGKGFKVIATGSFDLGVTGTAYDGFGDNVTDGLTDLNGNSMSASTTALSDALGSAVTISGSNPVNYTYTGPNNTPETIAVAYTSVYYASVGFGCYNSWRGWLSVPSSIQYPDGSKYTFGYDAAGRLSSVTYPGGGVVSYSHSMVVQCSPFTVIESFTQSDSLDGGNSWEWLYNDSSGGNETTQIDPYSNNVVTDFDNAGNVTEVDTYNAAQQVNTVLVTGSVYNRTWTTQLHGVTDLVASHNQVMDGEGFTTSTSDTDWGSGSPGALLRQTSNGYTALANGEVLTSSTAEDGTGNELAKTTWTVDSHGNPLSETDYVTNGSSGALTTSFGVNSNGTVHTITEPNAAVTAFGYACGSGFFPSSVQTVVGTTTAAWDCNGGVETGSTDLNNRSTSTVYDAMWRPSTVTRADSSAVNFSYPSSSNGFSRIENWISAGGANYDDAVTTLDTLGRPILGQMRQASGGASFDTVQTCYDAMSRPVFVTVPYTGTLGQKQFSSCPTQKTSGGTLTTYDGLSRPISTVDGGGGESDYAYNQNDVLSTVVGTTGGPTVSRQEQSDGIARLQSVCEVTAGTSNWPNGACGQTNAASGYLTTYTYSYNGTAQGPFTTVTQNAQSGNALLEETRTFQYDQLGRLTSETNPETQQHASAYTYDSSACGSSAGDLVERQDPNGNTTCYSRDAAHRVTETSYSGPNATDNKYFVYGTSASQSLGCCGLSNVFGRLAEAYTGSPGSHKTDEVFSYSNLGQLAFTAQTSPGSGGWYQAWEAYAPDGARQSLNLENSASQNLIPGITYTVDGEGRATAVTDGSSTPPVTAAAWLPTGLQSTTFGSTDGYTDQDTYTFDGSTGRLTGYSFSVQGNADSGALGWLTNGELGSLLIVDQVSSGDKSMGCTYQHDDMGRLSAGNCGAPSSQTYAFDPFGNVCKTAGSGTNFCPAYNLYNQIASGNYDADGDLLTDPVSGAANAFDAEGRATEFINASVTYDALGRAVEAGGQEFIYAPDGAKMAVMNGQTLVRADIALPGGAEAVYGPGGVMYYRHSDLLGSSRLATTPAGSLYSETAFAPFGEPIAAAGTQDRSFTGKKQDIASGGGGTDANGQYDFPAREYSPTQSRWWTPDPAGLAAVDPEDPQSWNRYAYACDPLLFGDPSGMANPCTLNVNVQNGSGKIPAVNQSELGAIEARVNQIFAATPAADGNVTQVAFGDSGGAYDLALSLSLSGDPTVLGEAGPPLFATGTAGVFAQKIRLEYSGFLGAVAGTVSAHELVHAVTGIGDLLDLNPYNISGTASLMNSDLANQLGYGAFVDKDIKSATPVGFSKLSQAQANTLYRDCMNKKLKPPGRGAGAGGGGWSPGGSNNWWFWALESINSQPPTSAPKNPCPYGDCKK